jgi:hypothetical protein
MRPGTSRTVLVVFGFIGGFLAALALFASELTRQTRSTATAAARDTDVSGSAPDGIFDEVRWKNASSKQRVEWLLESCNKKDKLGRDHALWELISRFEPPDFLAAVADLPAFGQTMANLDNDLRAALAEAAIDRWLEVDEGSALHWLSATRAIVESGTMSLPEIGTADLSAIYKVLAARQPDWMFQELRHLGTEMRQENAIHALFSEVTQSAPEKARGWLKIIEKTPDAKTAAVAYVKALAARDPGRAITIVKQTEDGHARDDMIFHVVMQAASNHPTLLSDVVEKLDARERSFAVWNAVNQLDNASAIDPLSWIQEQLRLHPEVLALPENYPEIAAGRIERLVGRDPLRTIEWVRSLPLNERASYLDGALLAWSRKDPAALLGWLGNQPAESLPATIPGLFTCASHDPQAFARWADALPAGELRDRSELALGSLYVSEGRIAEALRSAPSTATNPDTVRLAQGLIQNVADADPHAAADWITSIPAGPMQLEVSRTLLRIWTMQKPEAAAAWVEGLPAGSLRDAAAGSLAAELAQTDPRGASLWFAQVNDPKTRNIEVASVYRPWFYKDPRRAQEWLQTVEGISESLRARLLRRR